MTSCLIIMHSYGGGAEKVTLELARRLGDERFNVTLACMRHLPALAALAPSTIPFVMPERPGLLAMLSAAMHVRRLARTSDVVLGSLQLQSIFWAALFAPGRAVGWLRTHLTVKLANMSKYRSKFYSILLGWALRRCRAIVCVSQGVQESTGNIWPDLRPRLHVLWNLIDTDSIKVRAQSSLPTQLLHCFSKPVLLGVGRLETEKAFQVLLQAHALLLSRGLDHHCCILGEGSQRDNLETEIKRLGLEQSAFLPGFMDPYPLMARAAIFCLSSVREGFGSVIVEALALGLPVVTVDCPSGPREILENGKYGLLVPMGDATALADALEKILRNGQDAALRVAGMKRADDFKPEVLIKTWEKLLTQRPNKK